MKSVAVGSELATSDQYNFLRDDAEASSYLRVRENSIPNLTVIIDAGVFTGSAGVTKKITESTLSFTAPTTNPRIDIIEIDDSGTISIVAGTESATPAVPDTTVGSIKLSEVSMSAGQTEIVETDLLDCRPVVIAQQELTKESVGLGNVDNFATATQAEAEEGTAIDKFMTPLRVADSISKSSDLSVPLGEDITITASVPKACYLENIEEFSAEYFLYQKNATTPFQNTSNIGTRLPTVSVKTPVKTLSYYINSYPYNSSPYWVTVKLWDLSTNTEIFSDTKNINLNSSQIYVVPVSGVYFEAGTEYMVTIASQHTYRRPHYTPETGTNLETMAAGSTPTLFLADNAISVDVEMGQAKIVDEIRIFESSLVTFLGEEDSTLALTSGLLDEAVNASLWKGNVFTHSGQIKKLNNVSFYLKNEASSATYNQFKAKVFEVDVSGNISREISESAVVTILGTSYGLGAFSFPDATLEVGKKYFIAVNDFDNVWTSFVQSTSDTASTYDMGSASNDSAGTSVVEDSSRALRMGISTSVPASEIAKNKFDGFISESGVTGDVKKLKVSGVTSGFSGLLVAENYKVGANGSVVQSGEGVEIGGALTDSSIVIGKSFTGTEEKKIGDFIQHSINFSSTNQEVEVPHNLGRIPERISIKCVYTGNGSYGSNGAWKRGGANSCVYQWDSTAGQSSTYSFMNATSYQYGIISAVSKTTITFKCLYRGGSTGAYFLTEIQ